MLRTSAPLIGALAVTRNIVDMSMLFDLRRVPETVLESLIRDPSDIRFYLYGENLPAPKSGLLARLHEMLLKKQTISQRQWKEPAKDTVLSLDKNWHVLHYLLCRMPMEGPLPQATLMAGGTELGDIDVGYGPARALDVMEVRMFYDFLTTLEKSTYASGVTAEDFKSNDLYASFSDWCEDDAKNLWEYVEDMRHFFGEASSQRNGVLLYLY